MSNGLQHFTPEELFLSQHDAWIVLVWFFGGNAGTTPGWLDSGDQSFAQALLVEAVDASANVGVIQIIWKSTVTPPATIKGLLVKIAKIGGQILYGRLKAAKVEDFGNAKIYQMVKDNLTRNYRSAWDLRVKYQEPLIY